MWVLRNAGGGCNVIVALYLERTNAATALRTIYRTGRDPGDSSLIAQHNKFVGKHSRLELTSHG